LIKVFFGFFTVEVVLYYIKLQLFVDSCYNVPINDIFKLLKALN